MSSVGYLSPLNVVKIVVHIIQILLKFFLLLLRSSIKIISVSVSKPLKDVSTVEIVRNLGSIP